MEGVVGFSVGCEKSILSPLPAGLYIVVTLSHLAGDEQEFFSDARLLLAFILLGVFSISTLSVGVSYQLMLPAAAFQLVLGLIAHTVCANQERT